MTFTLLNAIGWTIPLWRSLRRTVASSICRRVGSEGAYTSQSSRPTRRLNGGFARVKARFAKTVDLPTPLSQE